MLRIVTKDHETSLEPFFCPLFNTFYDIVVILLNKYCYLHCHSLIDPDSCSIPQWKGEM